MPCRRFCKILVLMILFILTHAEIQSGSMSNDSNTAGYHTEGNVRAKRSCSSPRLVSQFISLVEKLEQHYTTNGETRTIKDIANIIRRRAYGSWKFNYASGDIFGFPGSGKIPDNVFTQSELNLLDNMMQHGFYTSSKTETGVALHDYGRSTIAMGHVIAGICAGLERDRELSLVTLFKGLTHHLDNLYLMTLGGDLGQSAVYKHSNITPALLGPGGSWDSSSCPTRYIPSTTDESEATDAEIMGDLDGFNIGSKLGTLEEKDRPNLSLVLKQYYERGYRGVSNDPLYRYSKRVTAFYDLVTKPELKKQTIAFAEALIANVYGGYGSSYGGSYGGSYGNSYGGAYGDTYRGAYSYEKGRKTTKRDIPEIANDIVNKFYKYKFICRPHTMETMINIIKEIEHKADTDCGKVCSYLRSLSSETICRQTFWSGILGTPLSFPKDALAKSDKSLLQVLMDHKILNKVESGVITDNDHGDTIAISRVIAGIEAGLRRLRVKFPFKPSDNVLSATVGWELCHAMQQKISLSRPVFGNKGEWDDKSCPELYNYKDLIPATTLAELYGAMDGFILGNNIAEIMKNNPSAKLSDILTQYYGSGLSIDSQIRNTARKDFFVSIIMSRTNLITELKTICGLCKTGLFSLYMPHGPPEQLIKDTVNEFYGQILGVKIGTSDQTKYGDITKLNPTGCSEKTKRVEGLKYAGVKCSQTLVENDYDALNKMRTCYNKVGSTHGLPGALIAAMASRETHAGKLIEKTNGWGDCRPKCRAYGILQCDIHSSGLKSKCKQYDWKSCEHMDMMIKEVLLYQVREVQKKHPTWLKERQLQGGIAAYNFGYDDVLTWKRLDIGTHNDDYSNDIVARAQHLMNKYKWSSSSSSGSSGPAGPSTFIPDLLILRKLYPTGPFDADSLLQRMGGGKKKRSASTTPTDTLRLSYMFNQLQTFQIKSTARNAVPGARHPELGYFIRAEQIKEYLWGRFGEPIQARDVATLKTKAGQKGGVMVVDIDLPDGTKGISGLWDGSKMYYVTDYTSDSRIKNINLWASSGCAELAEQGDCSFYVCLENEFSCEHGDEGYALRYGYRYCTRFSEKYNNFNEKGKKWVDEVRKCLMRKLNDFMSHPGRNCYNIKEFAFKSHPDCYINSASGFCDIMWSNIYALWSVFEIKDFFSGDARYAWGQVADVLKSCLWGADLDRANANMIKRKKQWLASGTISPQAVVDSDCESYARSGDCRFYECFEKRFPCAKEGHEHLVEFEFPSCKKFKLFSPWMSSKGQSWLRAVHQCIFHDLLPLYRSTSLSCSDIREVMTGKRVKCMVDAGYCSLAEKDAFPIDRAMDLKSFPLVMKQDIETSTIMSKTVTLGLGYYRGLLGLRRQFGDAHSECHRQNLKSSKTIYTEYFSNKYNTKMKRRN